jgi:hypothetical protein
MAQRPNKPFATKGFGITSPKGKALWCKVAEPDRMYDPEGTLSTSLVCDPNDPTVQEFISQLEKLRDTVYDEIQETLGAKAKAATKKPVFEEDEEGNAVFKAKLSGVDKRRAEGRQHAIKVVDAKRNVLTDIPLVGNGSDIRINVYANPYYMASTKQVGISLIWSKMQIINLIEYSSGGGNSDFDEEDGFTASAKPKADLAFDDDDLDF